jgi:hypothetical protein
MTPHLAWFEVRPAPPASAGLALPHLAWFGLRGAPAPAVTLLYRVYGNSGAGGPVDYSTHLATVAAPSWVPPPLAPGTDWTFAVRVLDAATGLEERNTVATFRVVTDASGDDVTNRPAPPAGLTARAVSGGRARLRWRYPPTTGPAAPSGFRVYLGATPVGTVPYSPGRTEYATGAGTDPSGLADGASYAVTVRSYNALGENPASPTLTVVGNTVGPDAPDVLPASVTP